MITLTDKGAEKVREFLASQNAVVDTAGLRVGVRGGGCSGFQYALAFDEQRAGDSVFEDKGIRLLVDHPSLPYVEGSTIDFVDGLQGAGFKVDNPNVVAACGCGSSVRVAEEEEVSAVYGRRAGGAVRGRAAMSPAETNWSGNYTYGASAIHRPRDVDELR